MLFILFVFLYMIYLSFSTKAIEKDLKDIEKDIKQREEYEKYLTDNNFEENDEYTTNENYEKGIYQELDLCNDFIRNHPKNLYAIDRRASLNSFINKYEDAINDYRYLMKKEPKDFSYVTSCAMMYSYLNDINSALNLINNFYKNKKKDSEYFNALGSIFHQTKDYQLALKNYNEAIKQDPDNRWSYDGRASVYLSMGERDKYEQDKEKYKELETKWNETYLSDNKDAKPKLEENKDNKPNKWGIIKITASLAVVFAIVYFHPTQEALSCDQYRNCRADRTYFGTYTTSKEIKLNSSSNLSCSIAAYARGKHHTDYGLYIRLDGIAPFVFYVADSYYSGYEMQKKHLNKVCEGYKQGFEQYINNYGKYQYRIESKADAGKLILVLIFSIILLVVIFQEDLKRLFKK